MQKIAAVVAETLSAVAAFDEEASAAALTRLARLASTVPESTDGGLLLTFRVPWSGRRWQPEEHALNMAREAALDAFENLAFARREEMRGDPWGDRPARIDAHAKSAQAWLAEMAPKHSSTRTEQCCSF